MRHGKKGGSFGKGTRTGPPTQKGGDGRKK